ncbi:MAG: hypothetical protein D6B28_05515 [Gammaproteobacteria bacterium]|nr:MAG: hypothetical protein D6B28_05515 [Gammaproteobacteria bacterium]
MKSRAQTVFISLTMASALIAAPAFSNHHVTSEAGQGQVATPEQYFEKMVEAVKKINYKGILVFNSIAPGDGTISALEIVHKNQDQKEVKISSIDGKPVSIYRKNNRVKELLGGKHQAEKIINNPFENFCARTLDQKQLTKNYQVKFANDSVTAGRDVKVVLLQPKSGRVYGYSFYIDKETYMPLKMDYIPNNGTNINSYMFVNIDYPTHLKEQDMVIKKQGKIVMPDKSKPKLAEPQAQDAERSAQPQVSEVMQKGKTNWEINYLPQGFTLIDHQTQKFHKKHNNVEHFVFSDGIALISVYIESVPENQIFRGSSIKGAMSAYGTVQDGHQVVVVGKVPIDTLELVGNAVQQKVHKQKK